MMEIETYIASIPQEKKDAFITLMEKIDAHIPKGFEKCMQYNMVSYVVPKSTYPEGYHCNPEQTLPFLSIAAQKSHIAVYHMGIYSDESLLNWFKEEYPKHMTTKLDMGKSCIRFKNPKKIPYDLMGELVSKMTVEDWIGKYEANKPK